MKIEGLEVIKTGRISDKIVKEVVNITGIQWDNEQTILLNDAIYEVFADSEEEELLISKYTQKQFASKYGEGTLLDLLEAYE